MLDRASFPHYNNMQNQLKIWLRTFYFMSNFLWTVILRDLPRFPVSSQALIKGDTFPQTTMWIGWVESNFMKPISKSLSRFG